MSLQLSTIRTSLLNRKKDLSDVSVQVFVEWCNFIGEFAYDNVKAVDPERFISSTTFTVSSAPQTSALPDDFGDINEAGTGFYYVDDNSDDTETMLPRTATGSGANGFYISGSNVIFTGINDSSVYKLRYMPVRTVFTAQSDYFTLDATNTGEVLVPDTKREYLVNALDVLYTIWDETPGEEALADQRFVRSLDYLLDYVKQEPAAYSLPDYSSYF